MDQLYIDGQRANVHPTQTIKLTRHNSLLDHFTVRGSVVNDHAMPFTPINDKIFGYYRHSAMSLPNKQYYAEYSADGYILERGFMNIVDCSESDYIVSFTQNLSEFFGKYQNELLSNMPFGGEAIGVPVKLTNHLTAKYGYPTINNSAFYGTNSQSGFNGKINEWSGSDLNPNARVPMLFFRYIFEKIGEITNCQFDGDFFETELFKNGILINTFSLDDATDIIFANHLPEITITELLFSLRKLFNLAMYINVNTRTISLKIAENLMNQPTTLNWTHKVIPNNSRKPELSNRLQLDWELDQNDTQMKGLPLPIGFDKYIAPETQYGTIYEVKSKMSTIAMVSGIATMEQIGNSSRFSQGSNKFGLRMALWEGDSVISNNHSGYNLAWAGINNIHDKFWKSFEQFRAKTAYKKVIANLNAIDLQNINWHNNPNSQHCIYILGKIFLIYSIAMLIPLQGLCELEIYEKP
jgi:hypothetical protein